MRKLSHGDIEERAEGHTAGMDVVDPGFEPRQLAAALKCYTGSVSGIDMIISVAP